MTPIGHKRGVSTVAGVPVLERLREGHAAALLAFELANRAYFARSISDRGDDFFTQFADQLAARLAEQEAGEGVYYVLVEDDGSVVGRINLTLIGDGQARLGYRIAEVATGRGLATAAVLEVCQSVAGEHGIRLLLAATAESNIASQRVLAKAGFTLVGSAAPADVGGQPGLQFERLLRQKG